MTTEIKKNELKNRSQDAKRYRAMRKLFLLQAEDIERFQNVMTAMPDMHTISVENFDSVADGIIALLENERVH